MLVGALPIPVGHRVEVTYFGVTRDKRGLFGSSEPETEPVEPPRITDLETGVVYAHGNFAKVPQTFIRMDRSNVIDLGVREEMSEAESFVGVVRTCQVTVLSNEQTETWLEVEPSDDGDDELSE